MASAAVAYAPPPLPPLHTAVQSVGTGSPPSYARDIARIVSLTPTGCKLAAARDAVGSYGSCNAALADTPSCRVPRAVAQAMVSRVDVTALAIDLGPHVRRLVCYGPQAPTCNVAVYGLLWRREFALYRMPFADYLYDASTVHESLALRTARVRGDTAACAPRDRFEAASHYLLFLWDYATASTANTTAWRSFSLYLQAYVDFNRSRRYCVGDASTARATNHTSFALFIAAHYDAVGSWLEQLERPHSYVFDVWRGGVPVYETLDLFVAAVDREWASGVFESMAKETRVALAAAASGPEV